MNTLLGILTHLNTGPTHFKFSDNVYDLFSMNWCPLFSILGISINYQTNFLQVSDLVSDFEEFINNGQLWLF